MGAFVLPSPAATQHAGSTRTRNTCAPCVQHVQHAWRASHCAAAVPARQARVRSLAPAQPQQQPALEQPPSQRQPVQQPTRPGEAAPCCSGAAALWSRLNWELLLLAAAAPVPAALAEEGLKYDASRGEGIVKTLSGAAYIGLLLYFLFRVLNRRARKAREERLAGQGPVTTVFTKLIERVTEGKPQPQATPAAAFIGAVQAGAIGFGLFLFSTKVEGMVYGQDLPVGYTARNIAITVRTIIVGLLYLATFTFSANAVGLTGLAVQLLLFPDSLPDDAPASRTPREPQLPKVTVTSSPDEIRKAFQAVAQAKQGAGAGGPAAAGSSSSGSSGSAGGSSAEGSSSSGGNSPAASGSPAPAAAGAGSSSEEAS